MCVCFQENIATLYLIYITEHYLNCNILLYCYHYYIILIFHISHH